MRLDRLILGPSTRKQYCNDDNALELLKTTSSCNIALFQALWQKKKSSRLHGRRLTQVKGSVALFGDALYEDAVKSKTTELMAFNRKMTPQCANSENIPCQPQRSSVRDATLYL